MPDTQLPTSATIADALKPVLELSARGASQDELLQALVEAACLLGGQGTRTAIFTRSGADTLSLRASKGLSAETRLAMQTVGIGPDQLSSGRAAASGEPVIVEDILNNPSFQRWQAFFLEAGVVATWSFPLMSSKGKVYGTLTFYPGSCGAPSEKIRAEVAYFANVASLLIDREQLLEEAERRRRLCQTFLQHSPDAAYVLNLNFRFVYVNESLLHIWGRSWDEAIGKSFIELGYEPWEAALHERELQQVILTRKPVCGEVPYRGRKGPRIYDYVFVPVLGPDGEVEAIAGTGRDITESRSVQEALRASQAQREQELHDASRRKDEFLAMLAHELRNPLAPIGCAAELLNVGLNAEEVQEVGQVIQRQVQHMTGLVDELLDVSRVTRGLVRLHWQQVDLARVARDAVEQARPLLNERRHNIELELGAGPYLVLGDPMRLVQVVANLLNNAAKYTEEGGQLRLSIASGPDSVQLCVADNGMGMPPELLTRAFEPFVQEQRSWHRAQGGLGLGLSLVKSLVELHGGSVQACSDGPGRGSQVSLRLPHPDQQALASMPAPPVIESDAASVTTRSLRILVVDNDADCARMLAQWLRASGHTVRTEQDPLTALALAPEWRPELCLLDIGMPVMDGLQLARELRRLDALRDCSLVAVTGFDGEQIRAQIAEAGFDQHLIKPASPQQLKSLLQGCGGS
jgi:PAS domain S-box-containing protein